jgi:hypothetical protein
MIRAINRLQLFLFPLSAFLFFSGCRKETIISAPTSYNYFPSEIGHWIEYEVDSIYHSETDNNNDDSVFYYQFHIREIIDSAYIDDAGRENQIVIRYKREDSLNAWTISNVWTQTISTTAAYRTEDNVSFHKLAFPVSTSVTWNGNDANTLDEEFYSYEYIHQPATIDSIYFDSTISVLQIDENNFVETFYGNEIYAAGVGLVYKERKELGKRNGIIVKGLEYKMHVIGYGKN